MTIRCLASTFLAAALVSVVLAGCGAATISGDSGGRGPSQKTEDSAGPRGEAVGDELPEPPRSTLSFGGETVRAGLGSYCWISVCADTFAIPVSEEALRVPAGSKLKFAYEGEELDSLKVSARRIGREDHLKNIAGGTFLVSGGGNKGEGVIRLHARQFGNRARITTELPTGQYAVEAFVRFPQGDAFYGFRIFVE